MRQVVDLPKVAPIKLVKENGKPLYLVDGLAVRLDGSVIPANFGILVEQLGKYAVRGKGAGIAQFYGLVCPGLIVAKHIFRGLNRPLYVKGNMSADLEKLAYSWKPRWDYEWKGGPGGAPDKKAPPGGRVFVTIISPNEDNDFPSVTGWIEHWNWVHEAADLKEAPIEWDVRYKEKLWSAT